MTGKVINHTPALIQWLKEAILDENNAIYAKVGSAGLDEIVAAVQKVMMARMEALLGAYKRSPGLFFPDQIFINFAIVDTSESSLLITLTLLSGEEAQMTVEVGDYGSIA